MDFNLKLGDGNIVKGGYRDNGIYVITFVHPNQATMSMELTLNEIKDLITHIKDLEERK